MIIIWIVLIILCVVFYFLYANGYFVVQQKKALVYIGSNKGKSAKFTSCDGYIKRVVKFKGNRTYTFDFSCELSEGKMHVELVDDKNNKLLSLNDKHKQQCINVKESSKYYLIYKFESATGHYSLEWK